MVRQYMLMQLSDIKYTEAIFFMMCLTFTVNYKVLGHCVNYVSLCKPCNIKEQSILLCHSVCDCVLKLLQDIGSCALFSYKVLYDLISLSNCTKEISSLHSSVWQFETQ